MTQNGTPKRTRPSRQELEQQLQTLSVLTSRLKLAGGLGLSFGGDRDIYETLGYKKKLSSSDFIQQWKRHDIARAIVDRPVKKTWQGQVLITESTEENETQLEKQYKELDKAFGLKAKFMRADRLSQLGKYSILLLGFDDSSPETWGQPVSEGNRQLRYVKPISEKNAEISTWELDTSDERFGMPRLYNIQLQHPGNNKTSKSTSLTVHHSRVIHITPDLLEDEIEGIPVIETAFNRLQDLEKLIGGAAEMFWRGARPGYAGKADPEYKLGKGVEDKLKEQLDEYEHNLRRFIVSEGVDLESLAQQIADPKGHVDVQLMMLSALTNIPARVLVGAERGELASSQDMQEFKEYIQGRREEQAEPGIIRPFVDRMIATGVLSEPIDQSQGYEVSWTDLFSIGEKEKAEIGKERSAALANYVREPMAQQDIPLEGWLRYFLRLDDQEVEHLLELHKGQLDEFLEDEIALEQQIETETDEPDEAE